jgi:hypothetical protein
MREHPTAPKHTEAVPRGFRGAAVALGRSLGIVGTAAVAAGGEVASAAVAAGAAESADLPILGRTHR